MPRPDRQEGIGVAGHELFTWHVQTKDSNTDMLVMHLQRDQAATTHSTVANPLLVYVRLWHVQF